MNILNEITQKLSEDKPAIFPILKTEKINYIAVGLLENQLLKEHKTAIPTILTVLKGEVEFEMNGEKLHLKELDTFQIPINILHQVKGLNEKNVFSLMQEK